MRLLRFAPLILAVQLSATGCQKAESIASSAGVSCFEPASAAAPDAHYLDRRISVSYAGLSMGEVIRNLHNMCELPISYIEVVPAKAVDRKFDGLTVRSLLRDLADTRQGYVCRVVEGHVVLYPDLPHLEKAVRGVDIVDRFRGAATRRYVDYARNQVPFFQDVDVVMGGLLDSPLFDERVSLDPEARAIDHLSQLLGKDRRAYFVRAGCSWLEASGEQLLERRIDALKEGETKVENAVAILSEKANLPISFIQTDPEELVSLDLHEITVRQALDAIVARAPQYRYGILSGRLVFYPRDPKWEMRLDDVRLGPGPRIRITRELAGELSRRLPAFANLGGPWVGFAGNGKAYTYEDVVTVAGPSSVLELLVQLLGSRPSTYFFVVRKDGWVGPSLSVSSRDQLQSLKLSAPTTALRPGKTVQLKLIGTFRHGGIAKDLSAGACGTIYKVSDERILAVSPDGLVSVRGSTAGTAHVSAEVERSVAEMTFKVDLPEVSGALSKGGEHE